MKSIVENRESRNQIMGTEKHIARDNIQTNHINVMAAPIRAQKEAVVMSLHPTLVIIRVHTKQAPTSDEVCH